MSLANFITQDIPILGQMFTRTEDQYITGLNDLGALAGTEGNEGNSPSEIIIACKNRRRRICGFLSEGVKISGHSEWKEMFGQGVMGIANTAINQYSNVLQAIRGTSLQQPWQNRKFWVASKPFEFSFSFNFIAKISAKTDVFLPAQTLISFTYPRDLGTSDAIKDWLNKHGFNLDQKNTGGGKTVTEAVVDAFARAYAIPGPAIGYGSDSANKTSIGGYDNQGDAVTITIGNMFAFGACYLQDVDLEFSPTVDYSGYPTWCKCTIKATAMDANYCNEDGSFLISQFKNNQAALSDLVDAAATTGMQAAKDALNIAKATTNAIGITHYKVD